MEYSGSSGPVFIALQRDYVIERTIPSLAIVRDESGGVLPVQPLGLIPRVTASMLSTISFFAITSRSPTSPAHPVLAARLVKGRDRAEEGLVFPAQTEAFLVLVLVDPVPPASVE